MCSTFLGNCHYSCKTMYLEGIATTANRKSSNTPSRVSTRLLWVNSCQCCSAETFTYSAEAQPWCRTKTGVLAAPSCRYCLSLSLTLVELLLTMTNVRENKTEITKMGFKVKNEAHPWSSTDGWPVIKSRQSPPSPSPLTHRSKCDVMGQGDLES